VRFTLPPLGSPPFFSSLPLTRLPSFFQRAAPPAGESIQLPPLRELDSLFRYACSLCGRWQALFLCFLHRKSLRSSFARLCAELPSTFSPSFVERSRRTFPEDVLPTVRRKFRFPLDSVFPSENAVCPPFSSAANETPPRRMS